LQKRKLETSQNFTKLHKTLQKRELKRGVDRRISYKKKEYRNQRVKSQGSTPQNRQERVPKRDDLVAPQLRVRKEDAPKKSYRLSEKT